MQILDNKRLGTIFNNDNNNILLGLDGRNTTVDAYRAAVLAILDSAPGLLAQCVGGPEAVVYPTQVDTRFDTYLVEVSAKTWPDADLDRFQRQCDVLERLTELGTDPLSITIQCCRARGVPIVASYRMNAEDWYENQWLLSDFGRAHPEWRIPLTAEERQERRSPVAARVDTRPRDYEWEQEHEFTGVLDPAQPGVYEHRMRLFAEVAREFDVDGIELDFRRWWHMVSRPLANHPVLTRMLRDTRTMLDQVAARERRPKMILGARVGPSLADPPGTSYAGGDARTDRSCRALGLDVATWVQEGLVDYLCPSLFWPRWPGLPKTAEFVELAGSSRTGVYPTLFPLPAWLQDGPDKGPIPLAESRQVTRYKNELVDLALALHGAGASGISTFNWYFHIRKARVAHRWCEYYGHGPGGDAVQAHVLSILGDPARLRDYRQASWAVPEDQRAAWEAVGLPTAPGEVRVGDPLCGPSGPSRSPRPVLGGRRFSGREPNS